MALGFSNTGTSGGGDFLPIVKYDARAGRFFRVDREDGISVPVDITRTFKAVFDFENVEMGWISFTAGAAPDFQMMPALAFKEEKPPAPSEFHKEGFRMHLKLSGECGGDCREFAGTAKMLTNGIDALHDDYLANVKNNNGKLPVVVLRETMPVTMGSGERKSTNYQPVFEIVAWVKRPVDIDEAVKAKAPAVAPAPVASRGAPPSTGSSRAAAPAPRAAAPADDEDFG
jgi:hypothetical protein